MRPIDFEGSNATYGKPKEMTDEECMPVSAMEVRNEKGELTNVVTAWQPNKEDLEALNAGKPIYLNVCGAGMPPVSLFTLADNGESNG